jgi:hypothetical protein
MDNYPQFDKWKALDEIYADCERKGFQRGRRSGIFIGVLIGSILGATAAGVVIALLGG